MAYAKGVTTLANQAISRVGLAALATLPYISNINDEDDELAGKMERLWDAVLEDTILEMEPTECLYWDDPTTVDSGDQNNFPGEPEYVYTRPENCLILLGVVDTSLDAQNREIFYWYAESGDQIASNQNDVYLKHLKRITDPAHLSRPVKNVIVARWAYEGARPLGMNHDVQAKLFADWEIELKRNKGIKGKSAYRPHPHGRRDQAHGGHRSTPYLKSDGRMALGRY